MLVTTVCWLFTAGDITVLTPTLHLPGLPTFFIKKQPLFLQPEGASSTLSIYIAKF